MFLRFTHNGAGRKRASQSLSRGFGTNAKRSRALHPSLPEPGEPLSCNIIRILSVHCTSVLLDSKRFRNEGSAFAGVYAM